MMQFTFQPKFQMLMPIRLWLAMHEVKLSLWWRKRFLKPDIQDLLETSLRNQTKRLYENMILFWKTYGIFSETIVQAYVIESSADLNKYNLMQIMLLNYKLTIEYRHYARLTRKFKEEQEALQEKLNRMAPSWIKRVKLANRMHDHYEKEDWKDEWMSLINFRPDHPIRLFEDFMNIFGIIFGIGFMGVPFFTIMIYHDQIIEYIAEVLVKYSTSSGLAFPYIYAAFGYALVIMIGLGLSISTTLSHRRISIEEGLYLLNENIQERLAENAYTVSQIQTDVCHIEAQGGIANIDQLQNSIDNFSDLFERLTPP